jgi:hypothetical protein
MVSAGSVRFRESQPVNAKGQFWPTVSVPTLTVRDGHSSFAE